MAFTAEDIKDAVERADTKAIELGLEEMMASYGFDADEMRAYCIDSGLDPMMSSVFCAGMQVAAELLGAHVNGD